MLKSDMLAEVRERIGELTGDFWSDTYLNRQLDRSVVNFCHEERWSWLRSVQASIPVAAGSSEIELIDDVDATRHFALALKPTADTDESRLAIPKKISPAVGYELRLRNVTRGKPLYYYIARVMYNTYGSGDPYAPALVAHLIPTPDVNYTAEYTYYRNPPSTWASSDECIVPDQYQDAVVAWATAMAWLKELNGGSKAQEQYNLYNSILEKARRDDKDLADDEELTWGGEEPQLREALDATEWAMSRIPPVLG